MKKLYFISIRIAPWFLLGCFALICHLSQREKSITVDEFMLLPAGIYHLKTFDWRMASDSPPLVKCLAALPSLLLHPAISIKPFKKDPNEYTLGYDLMFRNKKKYLKIFEYGRSGIILAGCLLGWLLFKFGEELYGFRGGLFVLFLYAFNPNIIAHARLTTIDITASFTFLLSIYRFWKFLMHENIKNATIAGITLGIAQLSKFTLLILYPIFIIIIVILKIRKNSRHNFFPECGIFKSCGFVALIFVISVLIINGGYLFSQSFLPLNEYTFISKPMRLISSLFYHALPVPLPYDYLQGLDFQLAHSEGNHPFYISYLMGEHSLNGWWFYYLIAFLIKNPFALLILIIITVFVWWRESEIRPGIEASLCIWLPIISFFLYFSLFTYIQIGIRWLLPIFPLIFLLCGTIYQSKFIKIKGAAFALVFLAISYIAPTILVFPHYLSYFNIVAGGSNKGYHWLNDSNLDWGQDLPGLKDYMKENRIEKINLGYFGRVDPKIYGIDYTLAKREPEKGIYAISVNYLVGRPYYLLKDNAKELIYADLDYFDAFRHIKPVDVIGHTIYIFDFVDDKI